MWKQFQDKLMIQWQTAYVNYQLIQQHWQFISQVYESHRYESIIQNQLVIGLIKPTASIKQELKKAISFCKDVLNIGIQKYSTFLEYKTEEIVFNCEKLKNMLITMPLGEIRIHQHCLKRHYIKLIIKLIYSQINYLRNFSHLNELIVQKLNKGLRDNYISLLDEQNSLMLKKQFSLKETKGGKSLEMLQSYQKKMKTLYCYLVFMDDTKIKQLEKLLCRSDIISPKNYFLMGLYIGIGVVIFVVIIILFLLNLSIQNDDSKLGSIIYVFPMFRGIGLFIMYLWGLSWNSYGFTKFRVNYQLILNYGSHFSTHSEIIKRAGLLSLIYALMLLIYIVGSFLNATDSYQLPVWYCPFVIWIIFLSYIFFPNRQVFNPQGRKYFYRLLKMVILSPLAPITFLINWATDQAVSFIIPFKDFAYTICFLTSTFEVQDVEQCFNIHRTQGVIVSYLVALVPLLYRMIQCFKQAISIHYFWRHLQIWNLLKYFSAVVTATVSFLSIIYPSLNYVFIISSIFNTLYSYFWDLKYDWGLLQRNSKYRFLRSQLSFKKPGLYYSAIAANLVFRCAWTLTISPSVIILIPSTFLLFLIGSIQIFRRCMWNFFRIEKQHLENCAKLSVNGVEVNQIFIKILEQSPKNQMERDIIIENTMSYFKYEEIHRIFDEGESFITSQMIQVKKQQFKNLLLAENQLANNSKYQIKSRILREAHKKLF